MSASRNPPRVGAGACAALDCGEAGAGAAFAGVPCGAGGLAAAPASVVSRVAISAPCETLSPIFTFTSFTVPACVEGTSIVALSLSSVTRESSLRTASPGFTRISMTGTSLKSPMSGTLISMVATAVPYNMPRRRSAMTWAR